MSTKEKNPLFVFSHSTIKNNKTIEYYKVNNTVYKNIYIDAYDMNLNIIKRDKVLYFTKHYPLEMYQIRVKNDVVKRLSNIDALHKFFANTNCDIKDGIFISGDHSLIVYDVESNISYPVSPKQIMLLNKTSKENLFLIQRINDSRQLQETWKQVFQTSKNKFITFERFYLQQLVLLPIDWFEFVYREDVKIAYDFTTETTKTFLTKDGLVLMDTVTVFSLHTEEAKREAWEKLRFSKQLYSVQKVNEYISDLGKDMIYGYWYASKQTKIKEKETVKTFNPSKVYKTLEELKQDFYKHGSSYDITDLVVIEDIEGNICKTTISEALLTLAIKKILNDTSLT